MTIHTNLEFRLVEWEADENTRKREVTIEASEWPLQNVSAYVRSHGAGFTAPELVVVQKIIDAMNELHAIHSGV